MTSTKIWIAHALLALWISMRSSGQLWVWLKHWTQPSEYVEGYQIDTSDIEWKLYRNSLSGFLFAFILHSVLFQIIIRVFKRKDGDVILAIFWIFLQLYLTSINCILFTGILILLATTITYFTRRQIFSWIICIIFVLKADLWAPYSYTPEKYYREFNFYLYTAVQVINFCIYLVKNPEKKFDFELMIRYAQYLFYPTYSITLIMLYEDFENQLNLVWKKVEKQETLWGPEVDFWFFVKKAIRLIFWFYFIELFLHFIFVNALFNSPFTLISGLHPVSKYSQMWRYFDQGLYQFLKNQVYIPLMGNTKNELILNLRRLGAMVSVFLFVLAWHGLRSNYLYWVLLSALELCIERFGRYITTTTTWTNFSKFIGEANTTRITALSMLLTVIPGIFGVFFFLGPKGIGDTIFVNVLVDGVVDCFTLNVRYANSGFVFAHLLILGYCFNNVCIYLEKKYGFDTRKRKVE
uniref:Protein-cysteine N-palmitoyltransferase Rasp n=1 Tax=Acrobeloides nanus TaxID=290746 RepID=A0A914CB51_9BILA